GSIAWVRVSTAGDDGDFAFPDVELPFGVIGESGETYRFSITWGHDITVCAEFEFVLYICLSFSRRQGISAVIGISRILSRLRGVRGRGVRRALDRQAYAVSLPKFEGLALPALGHAAGLFRGFWKS